LLGKSNSLSERSFTISRFEPLTILKFYLFSNKLHLFFLFFFFFEQDESGNNVYFHRIQRLAAENRQSLEVHYQHLSNVSPTISVWLADAPNQVPTQSKLYFKNNKPPIKASFLIIIVFFIFFFSHSGFAPVKRRGNTHSQRDVPILF
jgi:hypothetical protein